MRRLLVRRQARAELEASYGWYHERSARVADQFLEAVGEALRKVEATPEAFPVIRGRLRRVLVRGFTYAIYYKLYPSVISVIGVLHGRRHPDTWLRRAEP